MAADIDIEIDIDIDIDIEIDSRNRYGSRAGQRYGFRFCASEKSFTLSLFNKCRIVCLGNNNKKIVVG